MQRSRSLRPRTAGGWRGAGGGGGGGGGERTRASKIQVRKKGAQREAQKEFSPGPLVRDKERKWPTLQFLLMGSGVERVQRARICSSVTTNPS